MSSISRCQNVRYLEMPKSPYSEQEFNQSSFVKALLREFMFRCNSIDF